MGTRALVKIQGHKFALYKHWDGYPSNMLPWLTEFYHTFFAKRGFDAEYCLAQLVRSSVRLAEKHELDPSTETGYGIVDTGDGYGVQYTYELCENGFITVDGKRVWNAKEKPLSQTKAKAIENET